MKKSLILIISLFFLSLLLVVPNINAATRKQARKEYREKRKKVAWEPDDKKLYISGKLTGGILTGKAADYFDETSEKVIKLIFDLNHEAGTTLVIVTHNLELAAKTNRIIKLKGGRIVEDEIRN